jgi:hypothetical protein
VDDFLTPPFPPPAAGPVLLFDHPNAVRRAVDPTRGRIVLLLALVFISDFAYALILTAESEPTTPSSTSGENGLNASMDGAFPLAKLGFTETSRKTGVVNADLGVSLAFVFVFLLA